MKLKKGIGSATEFCADCKRLIMTPDEYYILDEDILGAFSNPIEKGKKICTRCFNKQSRKHHVKTKLDQIDAFPDYPAKLSP